MSGQQGPLILLIETATDRCSVALVNGLAVLEEIHAEEPRVHAAQLAVIIDGLLNKYDSRREQLKAVAVSSGPGSYTGLRIGVSTAKGICYALGIPLIGIDTTLAMANAYRKSNTGFDSSCNLLPVIDARRMEVYGALYDSQLHVVESLRAEVLHLQSFIASTEATVCVFGDAAAKCLEVYSGNPRVKVDTAFEMSALGLHELAWERFTAGRFEDLVTFEPRYLKEFVTKRKGGVIEIASNNAPSE
ncbi:MAG: tRNA (adenosine(37)-N6)-threonylcarbamoyltransferase complex dimerization subunit type 1 TsaB [Bacteroidota bacterium]